jgi:D-sedoheptulose 7-phosphate isomerase
MNLPYRSGVAAHCADYSRRLSAVLDTFEWTPVVQLADEMLDCWKSGRQVFLAGNGGSGGNAIHLANDLIYALSKRQGSGIRAHALPANAATLTCLANDEGYERVFALQLSVLARPGDVLIVFSGSGNSPNILAALEEAKRIGMRSYSFLGFSGGKAKPLTDVPIHVAIDDMQIAEDFQLIASHMILQWLHAHRDAVAN